MGASIRTFIAIELPQNIRAAIGEIQEVLKSNKFNAKWVRAENIHLTLKFLGNIDPAAVAGIEAVLHDTVKTTAPFSLMAKGLGVFPGLRRPRVIWIGIVGQIDALIRLQRGLDENLQKIGFTPEKRPFKGHLTIARVRGGLDSRRMAAAINRFQDFEAESFTVKNLVLFKSDLQPTGSVYTKLLDIAF
ncbi:MAG: RNA 2',3'-cyclic phosphodiesterase [Desulfobacterales bacterium]|jgi:2'-5' RNA ligase